MSLKIEIEGVFNIVSDYPPLVGYELEEKGNSG